MNGVLCVRSRTVLAHIRIIPNSGTQGQSPVDIAGNLVKLGHFFSEIPDAIAILIVHTRSIIGIEK